MTAELPVLGARAPHAPEVIIGVDHCQCDSRARHSCPTASSTVTFYRGSTPASTRFFAQHACRFQSAHHPHGQAGSGTSQKDTEQHTTVMLLFVTFSFFNVTGSITVALNFEKSWDPLNESQGSAIWRLWRTTLSNLNEPCY